MNEVITETPAKNNSLLIFFAVIAVLALAIGGYFFYNKSDTNPVGVQNTEAVAIVNGTEIDRATYDRSVAQLSGTYVAQGIDVSTTEATDTIKQQALATLVNRQLILETALKAGATADDATVETEYQTVVTNLGGAENLDAALTSAGLTEEQLRIDIKNDVLINNYLRTKLNLDAITVSDEEIKTAYDNAIATSQNEAPPLEDVSELIKSQLLAEKQQQAINAEIEALRASAEIQILI